MSGEPPSAKDATDLGKANDRTRALPRQVCMVVLSPASTDVRVMREATALVDASYQVTIVDIEQTKRAPEEWLRGVRLRHVFISPQSARHYNPIKFLPWLLFKVSRVMRSAWTVIRTPADVYHAHDMTALPACYVAARLRRKRLVFDAHELPLVDPSVTRRRGLHALLVGALRLLLRRCDAVITVSAPIATHLRRVYGGPPATLVRNIPPYQPPSSSSGAEPGALRGELRRALGLGAETRIGLYQGGFQENRALDLLVRAARYLAAGQVIVLLGSGESQAALERLIASEGVGERVLLLPPVPYEELLQWTAAVDVGLIVYRGSYSLNVQYCLPNKLFEYLMVGVPVYASALDAVAELVRSYAVGRVVESLEPAAIAAGLSALLADGDELARLRANALDAARRDLRWDLEQEALLRLYAALAPHARHADASMEPA